jgi:TatD DNase family protein
MDNIYKIFDSHAHYDDEAFDEDRIEVFEQLKEAGVIGILNCSASYESIEKTNILTKEWDFIYGAVGIHPENANEFTKDVINELRDIVNTNKKIVAIGEIGLDYYWSENPDKSVQKDALRSQMKLAEELGLPVIIHDRDAHQDTLEIIREFRGVTGIVHCFSGSVEMAKECLELGYYIGVTGVITFKNAKKIKEVVSSVPINRLLVETDCPYMAPEPNRGKRNQSDYIKYIIDKVAEVKGISSDEVNIIVNKNLYTIIGINKQ